MTKQQTEIVIIVLGVTVIAALLANQFLLKKKPGDGAKAWGPSGTGPVSGSRSADVKLELPPLSEELARKQRQGLQVPWGRNPFVLKSKSKSEELDREFGMSGLSISAIVMKGNNGVAIVNGQIVNQGDLLRGYKVVKIDTNGVVLQKEEETVVIPYGK